MNFTEDYRTAYKLLRAGSPDERIARLFQQTPFKREGAGMSYVTGRLLDNFGTQTISEAQVFRRPVGRVAAAFLAVRLAMEIGRQRRLVHGMFDIEEEPEVTVVHKKDITLFPITVNKTTVQVVDPEHEQS